VRKNCTPGSVRGAARKGGPYRGDQEVSHLTLADARKRMALCDSYSRLDELGEFWGLMSRGDLFEIAGEEWSMIDNAYEAGWLVRMLCADS
jgi:hypothetical protein